MAARLARREFLERALALCALPLVIDQGIGLEASVLTQDPAAGAVAGPRRGQSYFGSDGLKGAQAIARARLRALGVGETSEAIAAAAGETLQRVTSASTDQAALDALVEAIRLDFVEGRVVDVEGWVLSRTEVDLCLLTLVAPPA